VCGCAGGAAYPAAWAALAGITFIAFLGPGLRLPTWLLDLSPTAHVGHPPLEAAQPPQLVALGAMAAILCVAAAFGFRRRGVPRS
jgi:ABC-2 type transport system permease protein